MDAERSRPAHADDLLSRPLAAGYLAIVAFIWLAHVITVVLSLVSGRSSWRTENPWVVVPVLVVLLAAFAVIWRMERVLHRDRLWFTEPFRIVGLAYGSAVPTAWRRLRNAKA